MAKPHSPVVFARTGWMVWYNYSLERHAPIGGGSYNDNDIGSEVNNFRPYGKSLYGFARVSDRSGFNRRRVDPSCTRDAIEGVLVLLYATEPSSGGQRLVGWYRDATSQTSVLKRPGNLYGLWHFRTRVDDAVLLPLTQRTKTAPPIGRGGFGESNVRYAWDASCRRALLPWMRDAVAFAKSYRGPNMLRGAPPGHLPVDEGGRRSGQGWQSDPAARKAVETRAMDIAKEFFVQKYDVDPNVHLYQPYDLLCTRKGRSLLRVEVKGTTAKGPESVILTDGEVRSARESDVPSALFVVSDIELLRKGGQWLARGGTPFWVPNWKPNYRHLRPISYTYSLPRLKKARMPRAKKR